MEEKNVEEIQYPKDKLANRMNALKMVGVVIAVIICGFAVYIHFDRKDKKFEYPMAVDSSKVGTYPQRTNVGGGVFYDEVLEYRVWLKWKERTFKPFAMYEEAYFYAKGKKDAEQPVVLVRQKEYVEETSPGVFVHKKEERITEWPVEMLEKGPRQPGDIEEFMKKR